MSSGGKSSGGGGGGSSGKVSWPTYLQNRHKKWLEDDDGRDMKSAIRTAYNGSPYLGFAVYVPTAELASTQAQLTTFIGQIPADNAAVISEWDGHVDAAIGKVADVGADEDDTIWDDFVDQVNAKLATLDLFDDTAIQDIVDAYDERQQIALQRALGRYAAGLADIGAENSSAYMFGMALLNAEHVAEVSRFHRELSDRNQQNKVQFLNAQVAALAQIHGGNKQAKLQFIQQQAENLKLMRGNQQDLHKLAAHLQAEVNRVKIVAEKEYDNERLNILVRNAAWNLEIFTYAGNLLGSIQGSSSGMGGATQPKGSDGISQIGGAISGAASAGLLAASIGSGPPGWVIGGAALLGGAAGFLGGS